MLRTLGPLDNSTPETPKEPEHEYLAETVKNPKRRRIRKPADSQSVPDESSTGGEHCSQVSSS